MTTSRGPNKMNEVLAFENAWVNGPHARLAQEKVLNAVKYGLGVVVCGDSGVGKTAVAKLARDKMSAHSTDTASHYPAIYASLEQGSLVRGVVLDLLEQLNLEDFRRYNLRELKRLLYKQIAVCGVKLIIFDEFQHLLRRGNAAVNEGVCDFIKVLMTQTRVSVALFGMEEGARLLSLDNQLKTRFSQPVMMSSLGLDEDGNPGYFQWFLSELLKQYPRNTIEFAGRDNALRLLMASEGNMRRLKHIFSAMLVESSQNPTHKLSMKNAEEAYRNIYHDMIYRGRNGRKVDPFRSNIEIVGRYLQDVAGIK